MIFDFNLYSSLLLIGFLQAFIFGVLLFRRWWLEAQLSDLFLGAVLVLSGIYIAQYMLGFAGWYDSHDGRSVFMFYFPFHVLIFLGPTLWFYFRSLTNHDFQFKSSFAWHYAPGGIILMIYLLVFLWDVCILHGISGLPFPLHFETKGFGADFRQKYVPAVELGVLSALLYIGMILKEYRVYRTYLNNHFSETEPVQFNWLNRFLYIVVAAFGVNFLMQVLNTFWELSYTQFWISHFSIACMAYVLAILGYTATAGRLPRLEFDPAPIRSEAESGEGELQEWKKRITSMMEAEKPFLEPSITLGELAQRLNTNTSILSKAINTCFGENFNDFINRRRVVAIEEQLKLGAQEQFTLMSIAMECGFNSKATFNRAFRKFTGDAPREYLKKNASNHDLK